MQEKPPREGEPIDPRDDDTPTQPPPSDALGVLLTAVQLRPADDAAWDRLEELAAKNQSPDEVASLLREALKRDLPKESILAIAKRAVRFHDEWFSEPGPLIDVLARIVTTAPEEAWAFERLSLIYTMGERWDEVLALYDRALEATEDTGRRRELLDEAAHVAKDFARQPDRAIAYMEQLLSLRKGDAQLAASLERLLESRGRHADLVKLWTDRLPGMPKEAAGALRIKIAQVWLDALQKPGEALVVLRALLDASTEEAAACGLLERIAELPDVDEGTRAEARSLVLERHRKGDRSADVVRVLLASLPFSSLAERIAAHREIAARLAGSGDAVAAMAHEGALLALDAHDDDARARLRGLAVETGNQRERARLLAVGAGATSDAQRAAELRVEAAEALCDVGDVDAGTALYLQAFAETTATTAARLAVGAKLVPLLEAAGRRLELLGILETLAGLAPPGERPDLLARAAHLGDELGDHARALTAWEARLALDPEDVVALDASITLLERTHAWDALAVTLHRRAGIAAPGRRADLVRRALVLEGELHDPARAIAAWEEIEAEFGRDDETVDALARTLSGLARWQELGTLLLASAKAATSPARRADLLCRLGDAERVHLGSHTTSVAHYAEALAADPSCAGARAGLLALLSDPACEGPAVDALVESYRATDDWQAALDLLDSRLRVAGDDDARALILLEAAHSHEERGGDPSAALRAVGRAFALAPDDAGIEAEVNRLAAATFGYEEEARAYEAALATGASETRTVALHQRLGQLRESHLDDKAGALEAYLEVARRTPASADAADAVVRTASELGLWEEAAAAILTAARSAAIPLARLLARMATSAEARRDWHGAVEALGTAIAGAPEVPVEAAHDLEVELAAWHRDRREDAAAAEAALRRASAHGPGRASTLHRLAELQRRSPGPALVETLLRLVDVEPAHLELLREAADVALSSQDPRAEGILDRLFAEAPALWSAGDEPARDHAAWALDRAVELRIAAGRADGAVELLVTAAALPFSPAESRALLHRAAATAESSLADSGRAILLYRRILDAEPDDRAAMAHLSELYRRGGHLAELVELSRHELSLTTDVAARVALRLSVAESLRTMGREEDRIATLRDNLADHPGDARSIEELTSALAKAGGARELVDLLGEQAATIEVDEPDRARELFTAAAELAERDLSDPALALESHRRAARLGGGGPTFDALARLSLEKGDAAGAVGWLEERLGAAAPEERTAIVLRLADAMTSAGLRERARRTLETALAEDPSATSIQAELASLYRETEAWAPLVGLLLARAARAETPAAELAALREAAHVQLYGLRAHADASATLERAAALAPGDRTVRAHLADAMRAAGRLEDASALLSVLVEEFGRRRPPERAALHYQLAQVAEARGDDAGAQAQLELASSMDMAHPGVLAMLGRMARKNGQLDRAERAYRALLLIVRRQKPGEAVGDDAIGQSEVLLELSELAAAMGQDDRAHELLESAFATAAQTDHDARRFEKALRASGDDARLLRALEARLARATPGEGEASILAELGDVLARTPGRETEALDASLRAVRRAPAVDRFHTTARAVAARLHAADRYAATLDELAQVAGEAGDAPLASKLWLRAGEATEQDLGDPARAAAHYERAESTGHALAETWRAMARAAGRSGDRAGQRRALRRIVDAADTEVSAGEQTDALYRLAEIELGDPTATSDGVATLTWALDRDPQHGRALSMLRVAAETVEEPQVLALYERVARSASDAPSLLDALERLASAGELSTDALREAVDVAMSAGAPDRAETLLRRAVERAADGPVGLADAVWALVALAEHRKNAGDLAGAARWLGQASEVAEPAEAFQHGLALASLAAGPLDDLSLASATYERLLARDPTERQVWEPLLEVYRRLGADDLLESLIATTVDAVYDPTDRRRLRMERGRVLLARGREDDASAVLRAILEEDVDDAEAAALLLGLYERSGDTEALVDLLARQLEGARSRRDLALLHDLSMRLGGLFGEARREDAMDVFRASLEVAPRDAGLLRALLALFRDTDHPTDRADVLERLAAESPPEDARRLGLELADAREAQGDEAGIERALLLAFHAAPRDEALRSRLERWFATREEWPKLRQLLLDIASAEPDADAAVARFRQASAIAAEQLGDPRAAAEDLRSASVRVPGSLALVRELATQLEAAGDHQAAIAEVTLALEGATVTRVRTDLLRTRAELHARRNDDADAVADLEAALALGDASVASDLSAALEHRRRRAAERGDAGVERETTLRLAQLLAASGRAAESRDLLSGWSERVPSDRDALLALAAIDESLGAWDAVAYTCGRLLHVETGPDAVATVLRMADACDRAGRTEEARPALEHVARENPDSAELRARLRQLYQKIGAHRELAAVMLREAEDLQEPAAKLERYKLAGQLLLQAGDPESAIPALEAAFKLRAGDHETTVHLADAYIATSRLEQATTLVDAAIAGHKGRRSRELAVLQHRMARVALAAGDRNVELAWLNVALDADMQNGPVASELAEVATDLGQLDIAMKALRAVTMMKAPGPMTKAQAYLRQAMIAHHQGDARKAAVLARKAQAEDPQLVEAKQFLAQLGER